MSIIYKRLCGQYVPLFVACLIIPVCAEPVVTELIATGNSWNGDSFSYPQGDPKVTAVLLRMEEGDDTGVHCHPVPVFGYIIEGSLLVETSGGERSILTKGDAVVETMGALHHGRALDGPVELVAFFAGAEDLPNSHNATASDDPPAICGQTAGDPALK